MASSSLLDVTQHLVDQLKAMNERVTPQTAPPLLARVINKLDEKVGARLLFFLSSHRRPLQNGVPFNETEQQKLCNMLKLELKQLDDLLETCGYVFEQCAYFGASGETLSKELTAAGLNGDLVSAFVGVWNSEGETERRGAFLIGGCADPCFVFRTGAMLRAKLSERSICPKQLESSDWSMHLKMGQQDKTRIKKAVAIVSLTTRDQDKDNRQETVNYEFTHDELIDFSKHLDRIQQQLDSLG